MPDVLVLECINWKLTVWTRDNDSPRKLLESVLNSREEIIPNSELGFSTPFDGICNATTFKTVLKIQFEQPIFYENREYEFEFQFSEKTKADTDRPIIHPLREIEESFRNFQGTMVRGRLNFGNNVGWFRLGIRYTLNDKTVTEYISFQVFPTKMDMKSDIETILKDIDAVYPLWRFAVVQKTDDELARSHRPHERFELLWLAQFKSLADDLQKAVQLVCRSPHSRLLPINRMLKAEKLRGKVHAGLEERIGEDLKSNYFDRLYRSEKRKLSFDTPENRFVKMVVEYSVSRIRRFSLNMNNYKENRSGKHGLPLSQSFFDSLKELKKPFKLLGSEPFFSEIGNYEGQVRESLVLHHRAGYARVYRIWQELKLYLDFFGGDAVISQRSVEQLYEIWCLLELKRILESLGFKEEEQKGELKTKQYEKELLHDDGTFNFSRTDGCSAKLIHEPAYSNPKDSMNNIYSWTTTQRPDILLEITLKEGGKIHWAFDAKYRIDIDENKTWPEKAIDRVPDDAINQMHRYRDALIYLSKAEEDNKPEKSRPIIGAFCLYPGWFDQNVRQNPYSESINAVGIGAFPLLPGQNNVWLESFLKEKLGSTNPKKKYPVPDIDDLYIQEPMRIAPYGMTLVHHQDLVLLASVPIRKDLLYRQKFNQGTAEWYHVPVQQTEKRKLSRHLVRELKYCAVIVEEANKVSSCEYIYPIERIDLKKRGEINDKTAGGNSSNKPNALYWLIKLGKGRRLGTTFVRSGNDRFNLRVAKLFDVEEAKNWDDIKARYQSIFK